MEKYIPFQKLSKAEKKKLNKKRRGSWGELNPITRTSKNTKLYNRKRADRCDNHTADGSFLYLLYFKLVHPVNKS